MRLHSAVRLGILACGAALPLLSYGQFQAPSKDELSMTADPKAPGAAAVYLDREVVAKDPQHYTTVYARIKILTPAGLDAAKVHISFHHNFVFHASGENSSYMASGSATSWSLPDFNRQGADQPWQAESFDVRTEIGALEGRTIHPDGTIVPLSGKTAELLTVKRGGHQPDDMYFTLPDVTVGSILEYRYQIRYDRFDLPPDWRVQQPYFIHHEHFAFTPAVQFLPERNRDLGTASTGDSAALDAHGQTMTDVRYAQLLPAGKAVAAEASGMYTLDLNDVPALPDEAFGPPRESVAYGVRFFYTPTPDPTDFWKKEMGYWMKGLDNYTEPTQALKNAVAEACSPSDSPLEKAKKLYDIVQKLDNTDFVASGAPPSGSENFPAGSKVDKILLDKKGTSNQIAYLYYGLARAAGLNPLAERVSSRSVHIFDPNLLVTDQLDSVLVVLNIDGSQITLDPGVKFAPFATLHWAHSSTNGMALIDGKVKPITTPGQKNTDNSILHVGTLSVSPHGVVSGLLKVAFLGQKAIELRQLSVTSGYDAVKNSIDAMIAGEIPAGVQAKVDHVAFLDDPNKQLLAIIPVSGTLAPQNGRIALPRCFFESRESNPLPAEADRTLPIDMRYPAQEQEEITYQLPAGYTLETKPADSTVRFGENAAYILKSRQTPGSITNTRILARGFIYLPPKDYDQLRGFYQKVVAADQQPMVLSASQAGNAP